jgi:hemerythrin
MSYLKWTEAYSVNNAELDEQHRKLFALVNDLHDAMQTGRNTDLGATVDALVEYTDYHFKAEEQVLRACEYPDYDGHREMHDSLTRRARNMREAFASGNMPTAIEVLLLLTNWLNRHILDEDRKYKSSLHGCAPRQEGAL